MDELGRLGRALRDPKVGAHPKRLALLPLEHLDGKAVVGGEARRGEREGRRRDVVGWRVHERLGEHHAPGKRERAAERRGRVGGGLHEELHRLQLEHALVRGLERIGVQVLEAIVRNYAQVERLDRRLHFRRRRARWKRDGRGRCLLRLGNARERRAPFCTRANGRRGGISRRLARANNGHLLQAVLARQRQHLGLACLPLERLIDDHSGKRAVQLRVERAELRIELGMQGFIALRLGNEHDEEVARPVARSGRRRRDAHVRRGRRERRPDQVARGRRGRR
mmetsp:Transcript_12091/g.38230  ORF Transcript_12091/g.38230 Transcript_12091/m.38230 type:complete len:281 (-) Transcript_12091:154-996(-)